ncbi:MAG: hypothetical protein ABSE56_12630 [Bryobacteraceae bacterium]|jgi:hypothetical protein
MADKLLETFECGVPLDKRKAVPGMTEELLARIQRCFVIKPEPEDLNM